MCVALTMPLAAEPAAADDARATIELVFAMDAADADMLAPQLRALLAAGLREVEVLPIAAACETAGRDPALLCVRLERPNRERIDVTLVDATHAQRALRQLALTSPSIDAVAAEELSQIIETAVHTLQAGQPLRDAPALELAPQVENPPGPDPQPKTQLAIAGPASDAVPEVAKSIRHDPVRLAIDTGYELSAWASATAIGGPRISGRFLASLGSLRIGASLGVWTGIAATAANTTVSSELWPSAVRICGLLALQPAQSFSVAASAGVSIEMLRVTTRVTLPSLQPEAAMTRWNPSLRLALSASWLLLRKFALSVEPMLDLEPFKLRFGVQHDTRFESILRLYVVRPGVAVWLAWEL